ncbi:MAG: hypothetical protein CMJ48_07505 [Planctomycetaceae bacterium]|nr:hypothetical protein [Planctomycetaceae bacterium]
MACFLEIGIQRHKQMPFEIEVRSGVDQGRSVRIDSGVTIVVGRGDECDLQLTDPHVSRVHCRLEVERGRVVVEDAGSTYGVSVDGVAGSAAAQFGSFPG